MKHPAVSQHRRFVLTSPHSDHNNRGHSSSARVCQSEERRQAGREVSTRSVSTCYTRGPQTPLPWAGEGAVGAAAAVRPRAAEHLGPTWSNKIPVLLLLTQRAAPRLCCHITHRRTLHRPAPTLSPPRPALLL